MECPRCRHHQVFAGPECERCGVVFARLADDASRTPPTPQPYRPSAGERAALVVAQEGREPARVLGPEGWRAAGIGAALAIATLLVPLLEMLIQYMVVLIHELGHAATGWLFGFPSIPAFDFMFGGGVTSHGARAGWLVLVVVAGLATLTWRVREHEVLWRTGVAVIAGYGIVLALAADELLILAMGHGAELVFAAVFLGRALTGLGCQIATERPLYAWIAFHIVLFDLRFAWGLATSATARTEYGGAKGGGHWMDFSRLAQDLSVPLETIALGFLLLCLVPVPATFAWALRRTHRHEERDAQEAGPAEGRADLASLPSAPGEGA